MDWILNNIPVILSALTFVVGGTVFVQAIRGDVNKIDGRLTKFEKQIEDEISELRGVVIQLAKQEGKINMLEHIIHQQGARLDRLMQGIIDAKAEGL